MAARYAWHIGIWSLLFSGVLKVAAAGFSGWIRRVVPRAGLLGSLAAIALVLISFLPFLDVAHVPVVGFVSLAIILTMLVARVPLPGRLPGALVATLVGGVIYFVMYLCGALEPSQAAVSSTVWLPTGWLESLHFGWVGEFQAALSYLPVVIPFALATIIGGIDCTESAAAAGDVYSTRQITFVEGLATLLAGCFGGVIQTTPYIGHPAYKAMGGRAAYTLVIGSAGILGYFGSLYAIIPTPGGLSDPDLHRPGDHRAKLHRHTAAALSCRGAGMSAGAGLSDHAVRRSSAGATGTSIAKLVPLPGPLGEQLQTLRVLSTGFILTSLLWGAMLASIIDRRLHSTASA